MPERITGRARRARRSSHTRGGVGLALAGGGPLGGIYEVGALLALADSLEGVDFNDLDVYVGVSSGSYVAAALANGISPSQLYRLFIDDGIDAALTPEVFLRPAFAEFARRIAALPLLVAHAVLQYLCNPRHGIMEPFSTLGRAMPTGVFDNSSIDRVLRQLFAGPGRTNDFRELPNKLFLVATNLDTGASVVFGSRGRDHVPIARAIEASSALPGLFPPVSIEGEHYVDGALNKTLHASVALDQGIDLLLCVNPLVPFDASRARAASHHLTIEKLNQGGLLLVLSQTFRAIIHSRLKVGMEKYGTQYPNADILLFEPEREDADMFFANIFSYAQRKHLCAAAFRKTRHALIKRAASLTPQLARHGIRLRVEHLDDADRTVRDALVDPRPLHARALRHTGVRDTARDLAYALDQLERWLARAH